MNSPRPEQLLTKRCPLCASTTTTPFLRRSGVPVLTNLLIASQEAARQVQREDIVLLVCHTCGFVFNGAFGTSTLYNEHYENSQAHAPAFESYLDELVRSLVIEQQVRQCRILEVGCGDGTFLRKLAGADTGNTGYGFDPAYRGPARDLDGRLRFAARYYDEACIGDTAEIDVLICRHVIEHVPNPLPFLRMLRRTVEHSPHARAFFETPTIEWILRNTVIWDIYYEHCSYFSAETITLALELAGFHVQRIQRTFGDQYLWVETTLHDREHPPSITFSPGSIPVLASQFQRREHRFCEQWRGMLQALLQNGAVALLGAAGKGVTLANLVDPDAQLISCVVDLNPKKQGKFLPGTGHPIVSYEAMNAHGITTAVLLNPNYYHDALRLLEHHHLPVQLLVDTITPLAVSDMMAHQSAALELLTAKVEQARLAGKTIVFTNGVFDLLHSGHVQLLRYAKTLGEMLIVAVDSDASARRLKGPGRPIHNERDRLMLVAALDMVDATLLFEGETLPELLRTLRPHIYVKGGEYRGHPSPAAEALQAIGAQSVIAPLFSDTLHTSQIVERILALASDKQ
jgi:rfaE bifunctional protein nucleotidyltransferase chain/domain